MRWPSRCALIAVLALLPIDAFRADTFPVTKTADTRDGRCDADCSLREAIEAANVSPGADDVSVPAGTYLLTLGQLELSDDVHVAGSSSVDTTVDGNRSTRVFRIESGVSAKISDLTIQRGYEGHDRSGAGILNLGDLILSSSVVTNNGMIQDLSQSVGGGIFNADGILVLNDSTVSSNMVGGWGGGIYNRGGTVELTNSAVQSNHSGVFGGGIANKSGMLTLDNSTVSRNSVLHPYSFEGSGGGISNGGEMTLTNSTVSGNRAGYDAYFPPYHYTRTGRGGGISTSGTATLINTTVTRNFGYAIGGGIEGPVTLANSIVADNFRSNCDYRASSQGYNLSDDTSCGIAAPGDLVVEDAMLGPLAGSGGPTQTHDLLPGSPAIDAGPASCPPPDFDQRGVERPQGARCDIGAVEFTGTAAPLAIDIQPRNDSNEIRFSGRNVVTVAILGSDGAAVTELDPTTLAFGRGKAAPLHDLALANVQQSHLRDVNGDRVEDLITHYDAVAAGIEEADTSACLTGEISGARFEKCDAIRVVEPNRRAVFPSSTTFAVGDSPLSVAIADLDRDRIPDLVVVNESSDDLSVLLGNGDGSFQPAVSYPVNRSPRAVAIADFDGDAAPDLATVNWWSDEVVVLFGNGDGTFGSSVALRTASSAGAIAAADVDGDGNLDIAALNYYRDVVVLRGNGDGTFEAPLSSPTPQSSSSIELRDLDGDQVLDLVLGSATGNSVHVLRGNGDGAFQAVADFQTGAGPRFATVADLDANGIPDLIGANGSSADVGVLLGQGDLQFSAAVQYSVGRLPRAIAVGDFDLDRDLDLAVANMLTADVTVLFGNGDGTFSETDTFDTGGWPLWIATADLDGHRTPDRLRVDNATDRVNVHLTGLRTSRRRDRR